MKTAEIIKRIPGLTRDDIYNWHRQGYFSGQVVKKGKKRFIEYDNDTVELIEGMARFRGEGFPPCVAYQKASILIRNKVRVAAGLCSNEVETIGKPINIWKDRILDALFSGTIPIRRKMRRVLALASQKNSEQGFKLAYPSGKDDEERTEDLLNEILSDIEVRFAPLYLELMAQSCLSLLDKRVNAIVGMSAKLSIVVGATVLLAFQKYGLSLHPIILDTTEGQKELLGGRREDYTMVAVLTETVSDIDVVIELCSLMGMRGHRVLQIISVLEPLPYVHMEALNKRGIKTSYMFTRKDILTVFRFSEENREDKYANPK